MAAGMSPGAWKLASSGLTSDANGAAAAAAAFRSSQLNCLPARPHARRHSCTSHRPVMFFKQPSPAADAPFVGECELHALLGHDRRGDFGPHQRPRAGADVAPVGSVARLARRGDRHHGAGRVVRAGEHDFDAGQPGFVPNGAW